MQRGGEQQESAGRDLPLAVYVPAALLGPLTGVAPGSGIVGPRPCGTPNCPKPFVVYYEGDVYRSGVSGELKTLADRALHAAGRLRAEYPTVARTRVRSCDVVEVGTLYEPSAPAEPLAERGNQGNAGSQAVARISLARDGQGSDGRSRRLLAAWLEVEEGLLDRELMGSRGARGKASKTVRNDRKAG